MATYYMLLCLALDEFTCQGEAPRNSVKGKYARDQLCNADYVENRKDYIKRKRLLS